jgi:molybdopterin-containing oxidoreductase family iron-sulfur binding subunit
MHPNGDDPAAQALAGSRALPRLSAADVIISFDADFLSDGPDAVWNAREYAASRRIDERGSMSRLYVAESTMTATGGMADHRKRLRAVDIPFLASAVADALGAGSGTPADSPAGTPAAPGSVVTGNSATAPSAYASDPFVQAIVEDVRAASGRCAFFAGPTQPAAVHALVASLNSRFGGGVVDYVDTGVTPEEPVMPRLQQVAADMAAGRVRLLVALGTNPVYDLPAELDFAAAMERVPETIHVGLYRDETARRAGWHVPAAHYLEAWGDGRALDGTLSIVQPLIAPLYAAAHSEIEVLNLLSGAPFTSGYDLVRETMRTEFAGQVGGGSFEEGWRITLHDGFVPGTAFSTSAAPAGVTSLTGMQPLPADSLEVVFRPCPKVYDGSFSNSAWLQETPEMVTKVVWDNVALVSPATAERLGLRSRLDRMWHEVDRIRPASEAGAWNCPSGSSPVMPTTRSA